LSTAVHLSAVAGAGKTFLAVELMVDTLKQNSSGQVLFVAPSASLSLHFLRWLGRRAAREKFDFEGLLDRVLVMIPPYKCLMKCCIKDKSIDLIPCLPASDPAKQSLLLQIIDEAQDVFFDNVHHDFLHSISSGCKRPLLLSSQCQCSSVPQELFPGIPTIRLTEVIRSTQRIVAGAAVFHSAARVKEDLKSVCPGGPPVKTLIFNRPAGIDSVDRRVPYDVYVQKTVAGIWHVVRSYAGLSLHNRLGLLVPDDGFLQQFKQLLGLALKEHFPVRDFELVTYEKSLSILPPDLQAGLAVDDKGGQSEMNEMSEMIILDHMENSKGLENLIVMCIGLDEPIGTQSETAATRARLYRGITRAQVQAIVINEHISGGWLEFLGFLKYEPAKFEESKALEETKAEAAAQVISARPERNPEKDAILTDTSRSHASESKNQEKKTSAVNVTTTLVWDTDDNDLNTDTTAAIQKLMFDPRVACLKWTVVDSCFS
jgi:hypothetical protein